jgi:hypothetical protein
MRSALGGFATPEADPTAFGKKEIPYRRYV